VEVKSNVNKSLYKLELYLIKVIPMSFAIITLLNTVLSYFGIDVPMLSYIGSVSILSLAFMYLSSYVFKFCGYHRMFIHYTTLNWLLNIYDYYIGIPLSNRSIFMLYMIITGVFLFLILYLHQKESDFKKKLLYDK